MATVRKHHEPSYNSIARQQQLQLCTMGAKCKIPKCMDIHIDVHPIHINCPFAGSCLSQTTGCIFRHPICDNDSGQNNQCGTSRHSGLSSSYDSTDEVGDYENNVVSKKTKKSNQFNKPKVTYCSYKQHCKNKAECPYIHPHEVPCKNAKNGKTCTRMNTDCPFNHDEIDTDSRQVRQFGKNGSNEIGNYCPNKNHCNDNNCLLVHPRDVRCKYGSDHENMDKCYFNHEQKSVKDQDKPPAQQNKPPVKQNKTSAQQVTCKLGSSPSDDKKSTQLTARQSVQNDWSADD